MFRKLATIVSVYAVLVYGAPIKLNKYYGGCSGTQFGCCKDSLTACIFQNCSNCETDTNYKYTKDMNGTYYTDNLTNSSDVSLIGGCVSTMFGCCNDNATTCNTSDCSNCNSTITIYDIVPNVKYVGGCSGTMYGCCDDNITPCSFSNCSDCRLYISS